MQTLCEVQRPKKNFHSMKNCDDSIMFSQQGQKTCFEVIGI